MDNKRLMRAQMNHEFDGLRKIKIPAPKKGWIKAIREALSMSTRQLAARLKCSQPRIIQMEQNEINETLSLKALRDVAHALECDFVYYLIPKKSLEEMIHEQALKIAKKRLDFVAHSMKLEAQQVGSTAQQLQLELEAEHLLQKPSKLWNEIL